MKANRIHVFGGPEVIVFEDVPRPTPGTGEVLVRVYAAGVGPWDAWIRAGRSALPEPLPLTLGADLAGTPDRCSLATPKLARVTECWFTVPLGMWVPTLCSSHMRPEHTSSPRFFRGTGK